MFTQRLRADGALRRQAGPRTQLPRPVRILHRPRAHRRSRARGHAWWQQRLSAFNAPWAPVFTHPGELLTDPQAIARVLFTTPARPDAGPQARFPVAFEAGLDTFRSPAPELGQHNKEVLNELEAIEAAR
ncbi:CoA transferase [Streptomyces exfoliatus]|uniref:CoA transferase n=1 Tax=Streptomyces exfoliatus TaxID=1905 RepID=A0ABV3D4T5_STREX